MTAQPVQSAVKSPEPERRAGQETGLTDTGADHANTRSEANPPDR